MLEWITKKAHLQTKGIVLYHCSQQIIAYAENPWWLDPKEIWKKFLVAKKYSERLIVNSKKKQIYGTGSRSKWRNKEYIVLARQRKILFWVLESSKGSLSNEMKTKRVSRKGKIKIYRTTIRPLVLYGRGTWILRQKNEKRRRWIMEETN